MPPAGGESSFDSLEASGQLRSWAKRDGQGKAFESSAGFTLPNGATLSPDAAWVSKGRLAAFTPEQKRLFIPLCPEFVIEIEPPSDSFPALKRKMHEWIANGAQLGWLIQPDAKIVHIYRPNRDPQQIFGPESIEGEGPVAGFVLDLKDLWAGL